MSTPHCPDKRAELEYSTKRRDCNEAKDPKPWRSGGLLPLPPFLFRRSGRRFVFEDGAIAKSEEAGGFEGEFALRLFGFCFDHLFDQPDASQDDMALG